MRLIRFSLALLVAAPLAASNGENFFDNAVFAGNAIVYERYDQNASGVTRVFFRSLNDVPRRRAVR